MAFSSKLAARLRTALAAAVGEISWTRPRWLQRLSESTQRTGASLSRRARENPRSTALLVLGVCVATLIGLAAWQWYQSRPKPIEIAYLVNAPGLTCYACDPPGDPQPLIVRFEASVAPLENSGKALSADNSGMTMRPKISGVWSWDDDRTLKFLPEQDWPIGETFDVSIDPRSVVAKQILLKEYDFSFTTPAFETRITTTEFHQDPVIAANKKVVTAVAFTHPVDVASFEKRIELKMFDRVTDKIEKPMAPPAFNVVYDKHKLNAYVHTAQLEVPPKAGRLELKIGAGVKAARGSNETREASTASVEIPGLNSLKIADLSLDIVRDEKNEPDQVLLINTSFSVEERELPSKVSAWLLPIRHPDPKLQDSFDKSRRGQPFPWNQSNLRPEVLNTDTRLALSPVPGDRDHYELHSFRYEADPGRFVYIKVDKGLKSFGGYVLGETLERIVQVPEFPRELSIMHRGSLLAMSGEKTLTVFSRNIPGMRVEVGRLLPRQLQHLVSQSHGEYDTPQFHNWAFDSANITERFEKIVSLPPAAPGQAQYEAVNLGEYLTADASDRRGIFMLRVQAWNPDNNSPLGYAPDQWNQTRQAGLADARVVVITDLGLLVKRAADGTHEVFVQSIASGDPLANVTIDIIGRNGLPVLTHTTDAEGRAHFPDMKSFQHERAPVLYLARRNGDASFLPYEERGRSLDLSRFDVGGVESTTQRVALAAYLFSDRGLYRPGEQIRAAAIVRSQDWNQRVTGLPLRLEITDPRGTIIRRETYAPGNAGFGEILHETKESSPTGTYTLSLLVVRDRHRADLIGSTSVQVRDFQPDRLRMRAQFSAASNEGWVSPDNLHASIKLENLFGTPAENRRVTAQLTLSPSIPSFRAFPDYQFHDPQYAREGYSEPLGETSTDAQGEARFEMNLQRFARATYRAHFVAEGFEADGGRGVTAESAQLVSSMPYLLGYKADGALDYLRRESSRNVHVIAVGPDAAAKAVEGLILVHLESSYVSVLMRQPNGTYKYESRRKETTLEEAPFALEVQGATLTLDTTKAGRFAYLIRDAQGQQLTRVDYEVAGEGNVTRALEKNAELELRLSKRDYVPGEEIEMSIRAPYAGAGLITIERERVYAAHWFKASSTSSVQKIKLPADLEGNAYVTVTFVRDAGSAEIYTSPLSYAVQSFSIDIGARLNRIDVTTASLVKPGEEMTIRYSTARPSRLLVFAVDEGILQVANYHAPDPLGYFFRKRALEVSTMQILDLILPEFRHLALSAAPGGDAEGLLGKHLNPFRRKGEKPIAFWSGIVDSDETVRELKYTVPDYFNGTLRVLAVSVSDDRIGVHDGRTLVRGDFVLSPNAPTTVTPGDEFDVSVGVANNVEGSGPETEVTVELTVGKGLQIVDGPSQRIRISEGRESSVRFRLRARDELGAADLMFRASAGAASGTRKIDLSIRPATPYMTKLSAGLLSAGEKDVAIDRTLYPHFRKLETGISVLPLQFAHGFSAYLANYPYACTEQIVSQAMPAVLLGSRPEFGYVQKAPGADMGGLLTELRSRQNDEGAYKLWPGSGQIVEFVSVYTQHLLLEAAERGHPIPADLTATGNQYLRVLAQRDGGNLTEERQSAYAIYLLSRQGQRMAAEIAAARKRLEQRYRGEWEQDLAAVWLAASLQLMRQERDADQLISRVKFDAKVSIETYNDPMTRDALLLFVIAKHFPQRVSEVPGAALQTLAQRVNDGYYHSLSAGTTLLALDAYAASADGRQTQLSIQEILNNKNVRGLSLPTGLFPKASFTPDAAALRFVNESDVAAFFLIEQSGFDRTPPAQAIKLGLEVLREYTDASGKPISEIRMGDQIDVHLKFRGLSNKFVDAVALVDLLPGGFELVVPELAPNESDDPERYAGWQCQICVDTTQSMLQYADLREDRVVFYVSANQDVSQIVYRIKATNVGNFVVPPAYGEAMYDRSVLARSSAGRIVVTRP